MASPDRTDSDRAALWSMRDRQPWTGLYRLSQLAARRGYAYVGASRARSRAGLYHYGCLRRSDWLPVGEPTDGDHAARGYSSQSSASGDDDGEDEGAYEDDDAEDDESGEDEGDYEDDRWEKLQESEAEGYESDDYASWDKLMASDNENYDDDHWEDTLLRDEAYASDEHHDPDDGGDAAW